MCVTRCPVLINTGDLVRRLRAENQDALGAAGWKFASKHWGTIDKVAGKALTAAKMLPFPVVRGAPILAVNSSAKTWYLPIRRGCLPVAHRAFLMRKRTPILCSSLPA